MANDSADCSEDIIPMNIFSHWCLIPSVFIALALSFLQKRKRYMKHICSGRPGLVPPVNLLDSYSNRWTYAVAYGATTTALTGLFWGDYTYYYYNLNAISLWAKVFIIMLAVLEIGVNYYPFFACLTTPYKLLGSLIGFMYTSVWLAVQLYNMILCPSILSESHSEALFVFIGVAVNLPAIFCLFYLWCRYLYLFTRTLKKFILWYRLNEKNNYSHIRKHNILRTHHLLYVKRLLLGHRAKDHQKEKDRKLPKWKQFIYNRIYRPDPYFKFSPRIIVTFFVLSMVWYQVALVFIYVIAYLLHLFQGLFHTYQQIQEGSVDYVTGNLTEKVLEFLYIAEDTWYITTTITCIIQIGYIFHIMTCYRKHMLRLFRGEKGFLPPKRPHAALCVANGLRYSGFQIAYFVWSFLLIQLVLWIIFIILIYLFILPFVHNSWRGLVNFLSAILPYLFVVAVVFYMQILLANLLFVQMKSDNNQKPLALTNRRLYHFFSYFMFFYNIAVGLFTCLMRITVGMVLGTLFVGRIDRSILMRGYERLDKGYMTYVGMLYVESSHCHPVMVAFCQLLIKLQHHRRGCKSCTLERSYSQHMLQAQAAGAAHSRRSTAYIKDPNDIEISESQGFCRARARWHLAYTLLRNPGLVLSRKPDIRQDLLKIAAETVGTSRQQAASNQASVEQSASSEVAFLLRPCCFKYHPSDYDGSDNDSYYSSDLEE